MASFLASLAKAFDQNEREVKRMTRTAQTISSLEAEMKKLRDAELAAKTAEFRGRLDRGAKLEDFLPEAFAVVREAGVRMLGQRAFDVQLVGGIVLQEGRIAEMKTGEGKTLTATLPAYLNALPSQGVHIVTVNDYLAKRDSEWMGQIYRFLGLKVGLIINGLDTATRQRSYSADITYGTNNEFGFDYLRDNMVIDPSDVVQRLLNYAIVDEVDSILIDEARTPLIIAGAGEKPTDIYYRTARFVQRLREGDDFTFDEKDHTISITDQGNSRIEREFGVSLADQDGIDIDRRYVRPAIKARSLMRRDRDYVVKDGQVIIVDEFTGRLMFGRRWSDGLHEAVEAKEGLVIERLSQTVATITIQNYFRMYKKLAGMTGTAATEEEEFRKIYGMDVVVIPTNLPMIRKELPDIVYKSERGKFRAVVREIVDRHQTGQPVLVGTVSVEKSETLSEMIRVMGVQRQVLNAKYHEKEAEIVAQAGRLGTVTIATNMAGRGTDILLGGNPAFMAREQMRREGLPDWVIAEASEQIQTNDPEVLVGRERYKELLAQYRVQTEQEHAEVVKRGGLHIIGTERHEARRIDNQLRGRSGRQGDPGSSRFYVSLEDDLMRLFGADMVAGFMDKLGLGEDEPIEHPLLSRAIENAQKRVESRNFSIRKHVLDYDDVMNLQRKTIYEQRQKALSGEGIFESVRSMIADVVGSIIDSYAPEHVHPEEWDIDGLVAYSEKEYFPAGFVHAADLRGKERPALRQALLDAALKAHNVHEAQIGAEMMRHLEKVVLLRVVDNHWMEHLQLMDELREGIGLRGYGQRDPLIEYTKEAFGTFEAMIDSIKSDTVSYVYRLVVVPELKKPAAQAGSARGGRSKTAGKKIGRNDPCPCGSGKKYKHCCGKGA